MSRWFLVVLFVSSSACTKHGAELFVDLDTDLLPGVEFDRYELVLTADGDDEVLMVPVGTSTSFAEGGRIAELEVSEPQEVTLRLELTLGGTTVADREVVFPLESGANGLRLVVSRRCRGVTCDEGLSCVRGTCAQTECALGTEVVCGPRECTTSGECASGACGTSRCVGGTCLLSIATTSCQPGELCHPEEGCVRDDTDAGMFDGGSDGAGEVRIVDDFSGGTHVGTEVNDGLRLIETSGELVSEIFDAGREVEWTLLEWVPDAPYGTPLPAESETRFTLGNLDLAEARALIHFDWEGALAAGSRIPDLSSSANHAQSIGTDLASVAGIFGRAMSSTIDNYAFIPIGDDLQMGDSDMTWSFWVRSAQSCEPGERNRVYMGVEGASADRTHLWVGCSIPCNGDEPGGVIGGLFQSDQEVDDRASYCGTTVINDARWHHVALVKRGHAVVASVDLWVDGELEDTGTSSFVRDFRFEPGTELAFSQFSGDTFETAAQIDDAAIFMRALEPAEVRALYLRGARSVGLQVRACNEPDCSDAELRGPSDAGSHYRDLGSTSHTLGRTGRYIQYRVQMASGSTVTADESPVLRSVTLRGR